MPAEAGAARFRRLYALLLRLYPKPYREHFGEEMEQTFGDLCRERTAAGGGVLTFARRRWKRLFEPEKSHAMERRTHLRKNYRIEPEEYDRLLLAQGGACAICRGTELRGKRYFCVDHEHGTDPPRVRGLLCHGCNTALGCVNDEPRILARMIAYLNRI